MARDAKIRRMKTAIYILFGPDKYSLQGELENIKRGAGIGEISAADIIVLDSRQITPAQLKNICSTVPFLVAKRLVIVEGLLKKFESDRPEARKRNKGNTGRKSDKDEWLLVKDYARDMPETTVLVFIDEEIRPNNILLKELSSVATVSSFPLLKRRDLTNWIRLRVNNKGGNITPEAVTLLADFVGGNLEILVNEIDKLLIYAAGRRIESEDVRLLVSYTRETNIFDLVDAALQHQPGQAMLLLQRLFDEGTTPSHIIAMLARQVRLLILAKDFIQQKLSAQEAQRRLGFNKEYPFRKTMQQARSYTMEQLDYFHHKLLDTDLEMKTGKWKAIKNEKWEDELILDILVTELCTVSLC